MNSGNGFGVALEIASQAAIAADPGKGAFDNPSLGQDLEARLIGSLHDLHSSGPRAPRDERHLGACVSAIGKDALDERKHSSRPDLLAESLTHDEASAPPGVELRHSSTLAALPPRCIGSEDIFKIHGLVSADLGLLYGLQRRIDEAGKYPSIDQLASARNAASVGCRKCR